MALYLTSKAPTAVFRYGWEPALLSGDSIDTATLTVSSGDAVIDSYAIEGNTAQFFLSGGTAGTTTVISATATSDQDETLVETLYIPIVSKAQGFTYTVSDVLRFALRPITGLGATPTADELEDARENLDDMLAAWTGMGAGLNVELPTTTSDVLYIPDAHVSAVKANLRVRLCGLYGKPVDVEDFRAAQRGLQQVKMANLPPTSEAEYY